MNEVLENHFLNRLNVGDMIRKYGSPLYIYDEKIFRERLREVRNLLPFAWFRVNCSIKANSNLELLKIVKEEGLDADAMSPGEMYLLLKAGFDPSRIFFIGNNVSSEEMQYALDRDILASVDSLSQLETLGRLREGAKVSLRFNPGAGAGHHEKVVTAGKKTKFGIQDNLIPEAKAIAKKYSLRIVGVNQHIGSLFLESKPYLEGVKALLRIAEQFEDLSFVDLGGGFGVPYKHLRGEGRLNMSELSESLSIILRDWMKHYGKEVRIKVEPGRYLFAECGALLGMVNAVKTNYNIRYIGTDIGFNVLMRPVLYDSYHEVMAFRNGVALRDSSKEDVTIVGNICETGDILARERLLPILKEGDIIGVMDAGAYGYAMSSNYNQRFRPAEVLVNLNGGIRLIRRRENMNDLMAGYDCINQP